MDEKIQKKNQITNKQNKQTNKKFLKNDRLGRDDPLRKTPAAPGYDVLEPMKKTLTSSLHRLSDSSAKIR